MQPRQATTVYVAGPLFDEGERWWIEQIEHVVEVVNLMLERSLHTMVRSLDELPAALDAWHPDPGSIRGGPPLCG